MNATKSMYRKFTELHWVSSDGNEPGQVSQRRRFYLALLAIAITLVPIAAQAQDPAVYACISSKEWTEAKVLGNVAALPLGGAALKYQTHQSCVNYCRSGALPPNMGKPRGYDQFRPPYRYAIYGNGGWCFCGNEVKGVGVDCGECLGKMNCLIGDNYTSKCYINTERDHMVIALDPSRENPSCRIGAATGAASTSTAATGAAATGAAATGTAATGTAATGVAPPTGSAANRRPFPPTVQPGGWEPPFPIEYEGAYQMSWRNNGDPDGDVLTFGVIIWQYDWTGRRWVQMPTIRDQYGTYGMTWLKEDNFTFTTARGLSPRTHYAWMVWACDLGRGPAALCSWSGWGLFRTQ